MKSQWASVDTIPVTPDIETHSKKLKHDCKIRCGASIIPTVQEGFRNINNTHCQFDDEVFLFRTLKEVLNYEPICKPANRCMKVIGYYKSSRCRVPYLRGYSGENNMVLFLSMTMLDKLPKVDEMIEIHGRIEFKLMMQKYFPILLVQFWTVLEGNISLYIHFLKIQRQYLPPTALDDDIEPKEQSADTLVKIIQDLSLTIISM